MNGYREEAGYSDAVWDRPAPEHTVSAHVTDVTAAALILLAGGEANARGGWNLHGSHYWHTDEALTVALEEIAANNLGR